jgi:hypothetical protein
MFALRFVGNADERVPSNAYPGMTMVGRNLAELTRRECEAGRIGTGTSAAAPAGLLDQPQGELPPIALIALDKILDGIRNVPQIQIAS